MAASLKTSAQRVLKRMGLYERIKSSCVYDFYWGVVDRRLLEERSREVDFYRQTLHGLRKGDLIFDIGANEGHKTDVFLRLGARVVAVDPDETNQAVLRQRFLKYRVFPKAVKLVGEAVSESVSVQTLWIDAPGSAKNTLSPKWVDTLRKDEARFGQRLDFAQKREVQTTTLEELMANHGVPFFVKIDVEGHEPSVLRGLQRQVPYLSFEVNLPEFKAEGLQCLSRLSQLAPKGEFNFAADCQRGLALERWLNYQEFVSLFETTKEPSVEVFWRTPQRA